MKKTGFLQAEAWKGEQRIVHGFGTREEGGEKPSRGDWFGKPVGGDAESYPLLSLRQVHGDRIVLVEGNTTRGREEIWRMEGDSLITRTPGVALGVFTADCLPILLFDPVREAVGVVHAGWRGTARGVSRKAAEKMGEVFQTRGSDLLAALGPSIGPCCYEVDEPVKEAYSSGGIPWEIVSRPGENGKWRLDLVEANLFLLRSSGVLPENIHALKMCTFCRKDAFYSYRNDDKTGGRQLNFIALRKERKEARGLRPGGGGRWPS